jgi:hypothetical protein
MTRAGEIRGTGSHAGSFGTINPCRPSGTPGPIPGSHTRALARASHGCDRASGTRQLMTEANPTAWTQDTSTGTGTEGT